MKLKFSLLLLVLTFLVGCGQGDDRLEEKAGITSQREIEALNADREMWARAMETDLAKLRAFISSTEGTYEGTIKAGDIEFNIRAQLTPSIPDFDSNRVRTLEEITYEFTNLSLDFHIVQWAPDTPLASVGCIIKGIKPDVDKGVINVVDEECANSYNIVLADESNPDEPRLNQAARIASQIRNGNVRFVEDLKGTMQSNSIATKYEIDMVRVQ